MFSPLQVKLPCWLSQDEMLIILEEFARSVLADFGGVPPVQPLTVLLSADGGPPAPLGKPVSVPAHSNPMTAAGRRLETGQSVSTGLCVWFVVRG